MYYSILHKTRFRYSAPISENLTELRMCPRDEGPQRRVSFRLTTRPTARTHSYLDGYGNRIIHFDIPGSHRDLLISAESVVQVNDLPAIPERLEPAAWAELDALCAQEDHWDFLAPSQFIRASEPLRRLAAELEVLRRADPLGLLRELNSRMFDSFAYAPQTTTVDSVIDEALEARRGVCQDFAHIMIALVRPLGIPCRYVSGYLYHRVEDHDRSEQDATHAWVEALLPGLGWVGFDPTNNLLAGGRHIRTAVGRDYADVPPTKGVFRGRAESELEVGVKVAQTEAPIPDDEVALPPLETTAPDAAQQGTEQQQAAQQQQ